jgi:ParB-like chromosome segregation protein Spo0J
MTKPPQYEFHPFANAFPMMSDQEYRDLVADIKANGQREAITRYHGKLLDGRNREKACRELGIKPNFNDFGADDDAALAFVISKNLVRRHLTTSQRAMIAADLSTLRHGQRKSDTSNDVSQAEAAKLLHVSLPTTQRARKVKENSPELAAAVRAGDVSVSGAVVQIASNQAVPIGTAAPATNGHAAKPLKHKPNAEAETDIQRRGQIAVHVSICLESLWALKSDLAEAHAGFKNDKAYRLWLNSCRLTGDAETILKKLLALDGPCQ